MLFTSITFYQLIIFRMYFTGTEEAHYRRQADRRPGQLCFVAAFANGPLLPAPAAS